MNDGGRGEDVQERSTADMAGGTRGGWTPPLLDVDDEARAFPEQVRVGKECVVWGRRGAGR